MSGSGPAEAGGQLTALSEAEANRWRPYETFKKSVILGFLSFYLSLILCFYLSVDSSFLSLCPPVSFSASAICSYQISYLVSHLSPQKKYHLYFVFRNAFCFFLKFVFRDYCCYCYCYICCFCCSVVVVVVYASVLVLLVVVVLSLRVCG